MTPVWRVSGADVEHAMAEQLKRRHTHTALRSMAEGALPNAGVDWTVFMLAVRGGSVEVAMVPTLDAWLGPAPAVTCERPAVNCDATQDWADPASKHGEVGKCNGVAADRCAGPGPP